MAGLQMFSQVGIMGDLIKLDVEDEVDCSGKLGLCLLNQVEAVGLINKEIVFALAVGEPTVVQHNARSVRKDREV